MFFLFLLFEGYCNSLAAQENLDKIDVAQEFKSLNMDINSALTNQVDVLSPRNFKVANNYLEDAKKNLEKQNDLKKEIHHQIIIARQYLNSANATARISHENIEDVVVARQQAVLAGAPVFFPYDFQKSDELLQKVTSELEYNNTQDVDKNRASLQTSYSDLELRSIKHQNLAEARLKLIQAIKDGAKIYAPEKYKMALRNYRETLEYITEHRHDVDQIKTRALAVNESADQLLQTTHDVAESKKIPSVEIAETISKEESKGSFEDQIKVQQSAVAREQKTIDEKLEQARRQFTADEAEVERFGKTLIIRLKGLKFPTSDATLNASNLRLLGKVQRVVKEFGNREVEVEGHTDSIGSEALNKKLSEERAQTVKDYLLSIDAVPANKIKVIGRGELAPLSSNNTPEGRAENRRADVIIKL